MSRERSLVGRKRPSHEDGRPSALGEGSLIARKRPSRVDGRPSALAKGSLIARKRPSREDGHPSALDEGSIIAKKRPSREDDRPSTLDEASLISRNRLPMSRGGLFAWRAPVFPRSDDALLPAERASVRQQFRPSTEIDIPIPKIDPANARAHASTL